MNKSKKNFFTAIFLMMVLSLSGCEEILDAYLEYEGENQQHYSQRTEHDYTAKPQTATGGARDHRTNIKNDGTDVVTVMFYMCGSDLESSAGAATSDIKEIMEAYIGENVNIILETGGSKKWFMNGIDPNRNQRWKVTNEGMEMIYDTKMKNMSEGDTLSDFIAWTAGEYPANRYMLVLWDHGGGTVGGYAYDERFRHSDMMPISELNKALENAAVTFDMIGFDCCLMSTAETAFMAEKYADYMIASQRVEPGEGWHYTDWISELSKNPAISTPDMGKIIVDEFIEDNSSGYFGNELTLSVIDLTHIPNLFQEMYDFFSRAETSLTEDNLFIETSQKLGGGRAFKDNEDLFDLKYLIKDMPNSGELMQKLDNCIVYNGTTIADYNGLCLYFPYADLSKIDSALYIYNEIGIDKSYQQFVTTFANMMVGGQQYQGGGTNGPFGSSSYDSDYWSEFAWVDEGAFADNSFYEETGYDASELTVDEKGEDFVLSLSDADWELITNIEQRVFLDDGGGYVDLGADNVYEFDDDGDLLIDFDNTWVALNGELVCFYTTDVVDDGDVWYTTGVVPVLYEDEYAEIVLRWDNENPYGYVAGWRYVPDGITTQKGLFEFMNGMTFDILCDYYTYDGDYDDQYLWGEINVSGEIIVSYEDVGDADCMVYYELYDIYRNTYWTEAVVYSMEY